MSKEIIENIESQQLSDALSQRYLSYAVSTIVSRALPDVRDGLKPVHRRILYSMLRQKLSPAAAFRKCATVVGDVLGHYHPHGDSSVYDAMVRLAQDFSVRYPLIDGQGNFGNIDGDPQAAYRYTESKMTDAAMLIMDGIDENSVDMMPNFDGTTTEPVVMPGAFPNLLANGGMGIAVGMATNIPTHNVAEVCDALTLVVDKPDATTAQIMKKMIGPDFPTGGILIDNFDTIVKNYETGRGAFRIRARWEIEKLDRGAEQVVITEIPYGLLKSKLVEQIAGLIDARKLPLVDDIVDESTTDVRIVITPKSRNVPLDKMMAHLFAMTDLEYRFNMNFNVIDSNGAPRVMGIGDVLREFIAHQKNVLVRRTNWRLGNIERRLEILGGLLVVYLNLDRVIEIIRTEDDAKSVLVSEFQLTEVQVEAILNTRLRSLRKLEEMEIRREDAALLAEQKQLQELLASARGFGESVRLMADIGADENIVRAFVLNTGAKYLLVGRHGTGFIVSGENCLAQTKNGKQVMNIDAANPAIMCVPVTGDTIAMSGSNDKLLIFGADEIPEMTRGKGVILQKYNADRTYVLDVMFFDAADGFGWTTGRGTTKLDDWAPWRGKRASQGRTVPLGFPRTGKFTK